MTDTERNSLPETGDENAPARIDERLDCTGLRCPLPLLRTKQMLHRMTAGAVLEVTATDVGAERDIPAFVTLSSHRLLAQRVQSGHYLFWIEKGDDRA
jgi:tRNA 2-thiouridine synthesizing protein A